MHLVVLLCSLACRYEFESTAALLASRVGEGGTIDRNWMAYYVLIDRDHFVSYGRDGEKIDGFMKQPGPLFIALTLFQHQCVAEEAQDVHLVADAYVL